MAATSARYYQTDRGAEPVREYVSGLSKRGDKSALASFNHLLDLLETEGAPLGYPQDRIINNSERLWELRFGNHRCAYAILDGAVVLLHAWRKRTQKLDSREEATAVRRLRSIR